MPPAIVVNAYNRPQALARLLQALQRAEYPRDLDIPLVISIDRGGSDEVQQVAAACTWPFGPKEVLVRDQHLGLVGHFFACGDLVEKYGSIVYLEDDLLVSPVFYDYADQALAFYQHAEHIAGVSLYGLWFNGYTQQPFLPLADGSDAFFVQTPYTQGLAFTHAQWQAFKNWHHSPTSIAVPAAPMHEAWFHFDREDWFPHLARFVVTTDRYFVFPRVSLVTGCGDAGTHFARASRFFQAPLQRNKQCYQFNPLDQAVAVYDSFFEILPDRLNRLTGAVHDYDYTVDLYAIKSPANVRADYVLTSRRCRRPVCSFGKVMWPIEANVIENVPGEEIFLCRRGDVRWDRLSALRQWRSNYEYFSRGRTPRLRTVLKLTLARLLGPIVPN